LEVGSEQNALGQCEIDETGLTHYALAESYLLSRRKRTFVKSQLSRVATDVFEL